MRSLASVRIPALRRAWVEALEPRLLLAVPVLQAGVAILSGGSPIDLSYTTTVDVIDWNADGRKDLLLGEFTNGYVTTFLNTGTDASPAFSGGSQVKANGTAITTPYG